MRRYFASQRYQDGDGLVLRRTQTGKALSFHGKLKTSATPRRLRPAAKLRTEDAAVVDNLNCFGAFVRWLSMEYKAVLRNPHIASYDNRLDT
jgi:hypothetical protein